MEANLVSFFRFESPPPTPAPTPARDSQVCMHWFVFVCPIIVMVFLKRQYFRIWFCHILHSAVLRKYFVFL